jgi:hypothetical protein
MNFILLLAIVATSSSTVILVRFDQSGSPRIDAGVGRGLVVPHVIHLGAQGETMFTAEEVAIRGTGHLELRIPTINNGSIIEMVYRQHHWVTTAPRLAGIIAIGPGSDLLRVGGQIDFVRQSSVEGFLRLGGSEDNFITNDCLPDSVMRMATAIGSSSSPHGQVTHVETRVSVSIADNVITTEYVIISDWGKSLLTMSDTWVANIFAELLPSLERFEYRTVLTDSANNIQRSPVITLTFSAGGLRLLPEDYTRPTDQDYLCELLITSAPFWDADQTIRFNPLLIKGINARSTENEIILCDSSVDL